MRSQIFSLPLAVLLLSAFRVLWCETSPDQRIADSLNELAASLQARGLYAEAEADLQRVLAIRQAAYGPGSIQVAAALSNLGAVEQELGHVDQATLHQQGAFATAERLLAPDDPALVRYLLNEAAVERAAKRYDAAEAHLTKALSIAETHHQGRQQAEVWTSLGELYGYQARSDKADEAYNRALSSYGAGAPSSISAARR